MGTRQAFASIAMSAVVPDKSPTITFASLESHKIGGLVRLPREIDEQSIVPMGQFLARYGAIEFARAEDDWGFKADGGANYDNVKGIVQVAQDNTRFVQLATGKTKPSDAVLDGYPIIWTDVLEPNGTAASVNKPIAVFGALSFWWMGEHGHPRIDTSDHVLFVNDQLAVRFIEEIDFDYVASDVTAALKTAAS